MSNRDPIIILNYYEGSPSLRYVEHLENKVMSLEEKIDRLIQKNVAADNRAAQAEARLREVESQGGLTAEQEAALEAKLDQALADSEQQNPTDTTDTGTNPPLEPGSTGEPSPVNPEPGTGEGQPGEVA